MGNKNRSKKKKKAAKTRKTYIQSKTKSYPNKDTLLEYAKKNAQRGEMVGSTYNAFMKKAGFVIYKVESVHLLDEELDNEQAESLMNRIDGEVRLVSEQRKNQNKERNENISDEEVEAKRNKLESEIEPIAKDEVVLAEGEQKDLTMSEAVEAVRTAESESKDDGG